MRYTLLNKVAQICGRDSGVHTAGVRRARRNGGIEKYSCKADKRASRSEVQRHARAGNPMRGRWRTCIFQKRNGRTKERHTKKLFHITIFIY